jgi:hypothetical protein
MTVGCTSGNLASTPQAQPHVAGLACQTSDQAFDDPQLGWGFCYPATWRYVERDATTDTPKGVAITFDVTETAPGPDNGKFGFMAVTTYDRGSAASIGDWLSTNVSGETGLQTIPWGNSDGAVMTDSGRRFALTGHYVVELELHSGSGNLDLNGTLGGLLGDWRFEY